MNKDQISKLQEHQLNSIKGGNKAAEATPSCGVNSCNITTVK
ncbi:class I lanthipeptide [Elizabethkingia argenteiflava]